MAILRAIPPNPARPCSRCGEPGNRLVNLPVYGAILCVQHATELYPGESVDMTDAAPDDPLKRAKRGRPARVTAANAPIYAAAIFGARRALILARRDPTQAQVGDALGIQPQTFTDRLKALANLGYTWPEGIDRVMENLE